jgi:glyoxylase-like metal-dependent hydrolase (beta-lactamase superfamily II)/8-oxo-dGTP pyrophosphatase MutT (NUDIX family)
LSTIPANPITEAASVLLARGPGSAEVFAVRRAAALRFFGGFHALPGGKVNPGDNEAAAQMPSPDPLDVRRVAAARELFEETGVLLARRADDSFFPSGPDLARLRSALIEERLSFSNILDQIALHLRREDLVFAGSLVTPPFTALRFDTAFFVAELPPGEEAEVWPGELDEGRWTSAADLLDCWDRGACLVSPPTVSLLEAIRGRPVAEAPAHVAPLLRSLEAGAIPPIFFAPAVQMVPLRTVGLPPGTHTNAYLVGRGPVYLLDPGPTDPAEQQRLFAVVDAQWEAGRRLTAVVLTHHHPDHIGAAAACASRYGVPVWAHPWTARALADRVKVTRESGEGERLDLGTAPDGGRWHLEALHTPGHAPGHLAFYEPHYRLIFAGDLVSTLSSVVIAPPHGDLAAYLASLGRLRELDGRLLLPGHGGASARPRETIDEALAHRAKREEQLLRALAPGPRTVAELVPELCRGLPEGLTRLAAMQVLAGLQKLQREGRAEASDAGGREAWRLIPTPPVPGGGIPRIN